MKKLIIGFSALVLSSVAVLAADDPIAVRKALMQSAGGAAGLAGGMMKNEIPYSPAAAKAAISALNGSAQAMGDFFPQGSDKGGDTTAAPKIWAEADHWTKEIGEFKEKTGAAMQASGKDGPADLAAFQAAIGPVLGMCKECHEEFRIQKQ